MAKTPPKPALRIVADRLEPSMRRRLLEAIASVKDQASLDALESAVSSGALSEIGRLLDVLSTSLGPAADVMRRAFEQTGHLAATELAAQLDRTVAFDSSNPRAVSWAHRESGRLITNVSEETRQAVRIMIRESIADGVTVAATARRVRDIIGLSDGLAQAVVNYGRELTAAGKATDAIARLLERYSKKLLNYRATMIARTEIISASAHGQQELWRQAVDAGELDPRVTKRVWITTDDDRTCPICEPMDGQEQDLEEPFEDGDGNQVLVPPVHPQCRCAVGLTFHRDKRAHAA